MVLVNTGLRRAIGAGINKGLSFFAPLKTEITLARGTGSPTYTRATTAYVTDFEGLQKQVPSGCARFTGARMVRNLCPTPSTSIAVSGNKTITVGVGTFVFSMGAEATGTSTITFTGTATGSTGSLVADTTKRTAKTLTITAGGTIIATCTNANALDIQFEEVTGQSNQNPAEYVSVGVLSAPYHGAGADGCKFFDTENGNTVTSNVVTEATGAAIADATLDGYLAEGSRQNRCLYSQDFTNAAWVSGGGGIAVTPNTAVAPDGTTTADTLTASGANGTLIQDLGVVASAAKAGGLYLKRKTGTGNIDLTLDGGSTWTTVAVTSSWLLLEKTQTLADEDFGIRIVTSGDEVYAWQGQVETVASSTAKLSSVIPTTSAAVTRNYDSLSFSSTGNLNEYGITSYFEFKRPVGWGGADLLSAAVMSFGGYNQNASMYMGGYTGAQHSIVGHFGTVWSLVGTFGTPHNPLGSRNKTAISLDAAGENATASTNGSAVSTVTASPVKSSNWNTQIIGVGLIGSSVSSADQSVNIRNVKIWKTAKTAAQLQALTT